MDKLMKIDAQPVLPLKPKQIFRSSIMAGFECGLVHRGRHDLLMTTGHTVDARMSERYRIIRHHGLITARDGLVPGYHAIERMVVARDEGVQAIWDHPHLSPELSLALAGNKASGASVI